MKLYAVLLLAVALAGCNPQQAVPPAKAAKTSPPVASASPAARPETEYAVINWGQRGTAPGATFNVQSDGNSGISFKLNQPAPFSEITATFDGKPLTGIASNGVIVTATIPSEYLAEPGIYPVELQIPEMSLKIPAGNFEVK